MIQTENDLQQKALLMQAWRDDPVARHYSFSNKKLWLKQEEILRAVRKYKRVAVKSANSIGKSFIAADVVMDWLTTRNPSKVVTTASSWNQVEQILWKEIGLYCATSKIPIGVTPLNTSLKFNDEWFAFGISTDTPVRMQGIHSPNLLVVIDEASGIQKDIWDMIEALHPTAILAIGNPLEPSGPFYECFSSDLWHKITVSAIECVDWQRENGSIPGLVSLEWIKDMGEIHGTKSAWYMAHVMGESPESGEGSLISREWVQRARKGIDRDGLEIERENEDEKVRIIGADIATKHGNNATVIGYRYGHTIVEMRQYLQQTQTFARDQIQSKYSAKEAHMVVTDSDGVGESMAELLAEVHVPCLEFHGGYAAKAIESKSYRNLRSQFYDIVAKKFEAGLYDLRLMPQDQYELFLNQITQIKVKTSDGLGRFQIETKEEMLARSIKSPDMADCFMMMEYCFYMRKMTDIRPHRMGAL